MFTEPDKFKVSARGRQYGSGDSDGVDMLGNIKRFVVKSYEHNIETRTRSAMMMNEAVSATGRPLCAWIAALASHDGTDNTDKRYTSMDRITSRRLIPEMDYCR